MQKHSWSGKPASFVLALYVPNFPFTPALVMITDVFLPQTITYACIAQNTLYHFRRPLFGLKGSQSTWQGTLVTGLYWVGWSLDQCLTSNTDHHNLLLPKPIARSNIPLLFITPSWNQTLIFEFGQKSKREPVYLQIEMIGKLVVLHIQETPEQGVVWSNRMHKNQSLEIWTRVLS